MKLLLMFLLFSSEMTFAYPQMVRHGYARCTSCHVSPNGGGVLTAYGRALSKEVLSTWGREGEEQWHFGLLPSSEAPNGLVYGADYRSVQVHSSDRQRTVGRFIEMQKSVELGWQEEKWSLVSAWAADTTRMSEPWDIRELYLLLSPIESVHFRLGEFTPRFGIQVAEHVLSPRALMGLGLNSDQRTAEFIFEKPKWDLSLSRKFSDRNESSSHDAWYSQMNYLFSPVSRVGLSFEMQLSDLRRQSYGAHLLKGFTEHTYVVAEMIYQKTESPSLPSSESFAQYSKWGWEMEKGFHLIFIQDLKKRRLETSPSTEELWATGFEFFPRPHFELQGVWGKRRNLSRDSAYGDYAWLMFHFYL